MALNLHQQPDKLKSSEKKKTDHHWVTQRGGLGAAHQVNMVSTSPPRNQHHFPKAAARVVVDEIDSVAIWMLLLSLEAVWFGWCFRFLLLGAFGRLGRLCLGSLGVLFLWRLMV